MPPSQVLSVGDDDVFTLTDKGTRELNAANTTLSLLDLEVLVLVDGFSPVAQIAYHAPGLSRADVDAALTRLAAAQLIASAAAPGSEGANAFATISIPVGFFSDLRDDGTAGSSILKKKGYYVRIARKSGRAAQEGRAPLVLVIDDDPDLQKLIRTYFSMEGFGHRAALKRDDITLALRQQPAPDLILLDVHLPDGDGFDILARMRQHPALKEMPIVMLTAEDTRESVLKGLRGGADGYVTKPFEPDVLVAAVKTVLGLDSKAAEATLPGGRKS
jgi:two-component system, OmpR family, response regulator